MLDEINTAGAAFNTAVLEDLGPDRIRQLRDLLRDFITSVNAHLSEKT